MTASDDWSIPGDTPVLALAAAQRQVEFLYGDKAHPIAVRMLKKHAPAITLGGPVETLWPEIEGAQRDGYQVYFRPNAGGWSDREITGCVPAFVVDGDDIPLSEDLRSKAGLLVRRSDSRWQAWLRTDASLSPAEWRQGQLRLAQAHGGDPLVATPATLVRLAGTLNLKGEPAVYTVAELPGGVHAPRALLAGLPPLEAKPAANMTTAADDSIPLDLPVNVARAAQWLDQQPTVYEGDGCDARTLQAANRMLDLGLSGEMAVDVMLEHYRCEPQDERFDAFVTRKVENALAYRQNDVGAWAVTPLDQRFAGAAAFQAAVAESAESIVSAPAENADDLVWLHLGDLYRATPKPIEEILPGFVQKGVFNLLAGAGGTHKSRFCWQLVLAARFGADMLGRPVSRASGVVVSYEDPHDEVVRRVQDIRDRLTLPAADDPFDGVHYADRHGKRTPLAIVDEDGEIKLSPIGVKFFGRIKAIGGHKLVVIDSLYNAFRFLGQAKIAENAVNALIGWLDGVCASLDCTIIGIFHPSTAGNATGDARGYSHAWYDAPRAKVNLAKASEGDRKGLALRRDQPLFKLTVDKRNSGAGGVEALLIYDEGALITPSSATAIEKPGAEAIRLAVYETMKRLLMQDPPIRVLQNKGEGWKWKELANQIASDKANMILTEAQIRAAWAALMVPNAATDQPALLGYWTSDKNVRGRRAGFYLLDAAGNDIEPLANELSPRLVRTALETLGACKSSGANKLATVTDHTLCNALACGDPNVAAAFLPEVRAAAKLSDYANLLAKAATGRASNAWQAQDEEW